MNCQSALGRNICHEITSVCFPGPNDTDTRRVWEGLKMKEEMWVQYLK